MAVGGGMVYQNDGQQASSKAWRHLGSATTLSAPTHAHTPKAQPNFLDVQTAAQASPAAARTGPTAKGVSNKYSLPPSPIELPPPPLHGTAEPVAAQFHEDPTANPMDWSAGEVERWLAQKVRSHESRSLRLRLAVARSSVMPGSPPGQAGGVC